ncbi:methionyl-tRNA formyltransferase [Brevibacillus agri]|uniref:methionyl-tRNA formyltransferase n=1 Tax=Brevibacillus agri TaxID=51101 RepID=UPI002E1B154C|nr:methionyl-tRNA formyltransferase [Brevibacillus agri]MED1655874.1 methionyl-tRNA formyltransferase [Brevibacillus agri]MED1685017.1 methionyl-tRNA formyltransferase [Brevibacillus agri]MED1693610.1 methionyl-tRNA formyltransferase [Brevibacillus agri]MED1697576.1 methionyl-tRNA formyltransferase [Brevibacillus agri]
MSYIIASYKKWHDNFTDFLFEITGKKFYHIKSNEELTVEILNDIKPKYIFFPHWSYKIPKEIYSSYECVIFHMTDLPFGRGGSPLQNLISRGIYETQISALRCVEELDGGPIYLKRPMALYGSAEEIYLRAADIMKEMIIHIVMKQPEPIPQQGEVVSFSRRKPEESDIAHLTNLTQVYDYIRMLDADGYPRAFLTTPFMKFEFQRAQIKQDRIIADVIITRRER